MGNQTGNAALKTRDVPGVDLKPSILHQAQMSEGWTFAGEEVRSMRHFERVLRAPKPPSNAADLPYEMDGLLLRYWQSSRSSWPESARPFVGMCAVAREDS